MVEHVGYANLPTYFGKIQRLLAPGGLVLNHGITSGGLDHDQLGAGMGDFIEKYIFPGGELLHVSHMLREMAAGRSGDGRYRESAAALCAHAVGLVGRAGGSSSTRRAQVLQRGAATPSTPSASCGPTGCTWRARP